jgi:hypothetical protein
MMKMCDEPTYEEAVCAAVAIIEEGNKDPLGPYWSAKAFLAMERHKAHKPLLFTKDGVNLKGLSK